MANFSSKLGKNVIIDNLLIKELHTYCGKLQHVNGGIDIFEIKENVFTFFKKIYIFLKIVHFPSVQALAETGTEL